MSGAEVLFDRHAGTYRDSVERAVAFTGRDLAFFTRAKAHHLLRIGRDLDRPLAEASVLDIGCGGGELDRLLTPHVGRLSGLEVSSEMLQDARRANPAGQYTHYDGTRLPLPDRSFDLVFAVCVLHHVPPEQWASFLSEMWRVTCPGGAAVVIEHNPLNPLTRRSVAACEFDADAVLTGPRAVLRIFTALGVRRLRARYFLFSPLGGDRVQAAERFLGHLPLGGQYIVTARRP